MPRIQLGESGLNRLASTEVLVHDGDRDSDSDGAERIVRGSGGLTWATGTDDGRGRDDDCGVVGRTGKSVVSGGRSGAE